MTNRAVQVRLEAIKLLLEVSTDDIDSAPDTHEVLMNCVEHLKAVETVFLRETKKYSDDVPAKDRSVEVLALMGFIDLRIKEYVEKLFARAKAMPKEIPHDSSQLPPNHPLAPIINNLAAQGVQVDVLRIGKDDKCNDPSCLVHGKKDIPDDKKN